MKKIFTYLAAVSALLLTFSCNREAVDSFVNEEGISLKLVWSDMSVRTRVPGEDNENLVNSLDFYFYKDVTATSVYHYRETTIPAEDNYKKDFVPGEKYDGTNEFPKRTDLVDPDNGCTVFVIANLDESKAPASATLATLRAIEVGQTFLDETDNSSLATDNENLYFVMTGVAQVQGTRKVLASADPETIELNRLAAKITVDITAVSSEETADGITETWTPMLGGRNVRVYITNAVSNAILGGMDGDMPTSPTFFESNHVVLPLEDGVWTENPTGTFKTENVGGHFYTYPNNWEEGGTDTFLKIVLPWQVVKKQNGNVIYSAEREVYYKVILPEKKILSNNWYDLSVTLEPGKEGEYEVEIPATYEVVNWTSGGQNGVNSTLKDILYLVVDYNDATGYDLNGNGTIDDEEAKIFVVYGEEASVHYSASNDVGYKVLRASYTEFNNSNFTATTKYIVQDGTYRYSDVGAGNGKRAGYPNGATWNAVNNINTVNSWFSVGDSEDYLTFDHALNNTYTSDFFDISPYVFTVQVYLERAKTNPKYQKNVTFVQFPQTYLDLDLSPMKGGSSTGNRYGYVYVNNKTRTNTSNLRDNQWTLWTNITVIGSEPRNTNPNMYILTTGVLSSSELLLGDPRTSSPDNGPKLTNNTTGYGNENNPYPGNATLAIDGEGNPVSFVRASHVSKPGNVTLSNYYPADIAKSEKFIAPKLRIQSGYGRRGSHGANTSGNQRFDYTWGAAWNRCAAYQEDGYPAGRWRLPTVAEIEYINTLSEHHFIPSLFYGTDYYSASPGVAYNSGRRVNNQYLGSVRCVYDDWYWGSDPVWDQTSDDSFKWGD